MEEKCIFRYSVTNSYRLPLFWIEVLDAKEDNVRTYSFNSKSWNGDTDIIKPDHISVGYPVITKIKETLENQYELFAISETEEPPSIDGVDNYFRFVSGDKTAEITSCNLWYFEDKDARDLNGNKPLRAWIVLSVFHRIRELLVKAGIDPAYLDLDYDED